MSTEIAIIKRENIETIVNNAPISYSENIASHDKCIEVGQNILNRINHEGMNDELDAQAAQYLDRARKTVKKMNEKRAPVTKLFDEIRTTFTSLENDVDPAKKESLPYKIQQARNAYANKKRIEAEEAQRREMIRQQAEAARNKYRIDVEEDYKNSFNRVITSNINQITSLNRSVTLENYNTISEQIKNYNCKLNQINWTSNVYLPANLDINEAQKIRKEVLDMLLPRFSEQFSFEIESTRDTYLDMLPSKKRELEAAAKASKEEAERIKAEIAAREAEEERKKEEERKRKEAEEEQQKRLAQESASVGELFGAVSATMPEYQPKMQVKKKIVPLNVEAFLPIISTWWTKEGCTLSVDELTKLFKRQITFCEKLANDKNNPITLESEHIEYVDDVKAK